MLQGIGIGVQSCLVAAVGSQRCVDVVCEC
jgi:hypothetical protein